MAGIPARHTSMLSTSRLVGEHASAVTAGTVTSRTGLPERSSPGSQLTKAPLRHPATMPLPSLRSCQTLCGEHWCRFTQQIC